MFLANMREISRTFSKVLVAGGGRLVLASGSPQRCAILEQLGLSFTIVVSGAAELADGPPHEVVAENAYRKAAAVAAVAGREEAAALVLGVDTVVALGARMYGKPVDEAAARATLRALAGRRHRVLSGVCLLDGERRLTGVAETVVEFRAVDEALLDWYVASGEWRGRAGGYAIQGRGAALVARIEGDYLNVVGLPVALLLELVPELLQLAGRSRD
jgi:septum formation protein